MSQLTTLTIATRQSRLALWQAYHVRDRLLHLYPQMDIQLLEMTTKGDQILDRALSKVGGKGLFVKELETALLDGRADLAVHSLKDVSTELAPEFCLTAILEREDDRDAFVSRDYNSLAELPEGAIVGTSSLRREAQIRAQFPHLQVQSLRGNLDTRLRKLDEGQYAAIILAAAGLKRLGLTHRIRAYLSHNESLPAVGQGALGIEILSQREDLKSLLAPLICPQTTACVTAERAVSKVLGGSCQVPLAANATIEDGVLNLVAIVAQPDGQKLVRACARGGIDDAQQIGEYVAQNLLVKGAADILASCLSS